MASSGGKFDPKQPWFIAVMVLVFLLLLGGVARAYMLRRKGTLGLRTFFGGKAKTTTTTIEPA